MNGDMTNEIVTCDFCGMQVERRYTTPNWRETGWNICCECEDDAPKIIDVLVEELHRWAQREYEREK